jgi:streptomycin 6-kinase
MVYSEREDMKLLTWHDGESTYTLYTNDSEEVLMKVAENFQIID